ncbi:GNAT family N-acetyltransferase [Rhodoblastus sp.]|uniref:GNAT family N-acetyltransferase n=1 Tax=Rhodoblastus sp. TaxID=1962975 RepID=UPI0026178045|nr:GNAT family N-acetyltransferase [Rhodoblastus sp.]
MPKVPCAEARRRFTRLGPDDADRYADHLLRLPDEDRRLRFFDETPEFLIQLHAGAASADGRIVAICEDEGFIRAAGELLPDPERPEVGELAFSVEKDCQRQGIGGALMRELIEAGARAGFERLELELLPENKSMLSLAQRFAERMETRGGHLFAVIPVPRDGATP